MHLDDMSALEYFSGNQFDDGRKNPFTFNLKTSINFCGILCSLSAYTLNKIISLDDRHSILDTPYKLQKAVNYISKHYNEKITLDELAAYCNISKQQLTRQFKTNLQMTPMKYVTEFKLLRTKTIFQRFLLGYSVNRRPNTSHPQKHKIKSMMAKHIFFVHAVILFMLYICSKIRISQSGIGNST